MLLHFLFKKKCYFGILNLLCYQYWLRFIEFRCFKRNTVVLFVGIWSFVFLRGVDLFLFWKTFFADIGYSFLQSLQSMNCLMIQLLPSHLFLDQYLWFWCCLVLSFEMFFFFYFTLKMLIMLTLSSSLSIAWFYIVWRTKHKYGGCDGYGWIGNVSR